LDDLDAKIMAIFTKSPFEFESARSIAKTLRVAHPTILLHLYDYIGFRLFHLHWVPHTLMHNLREKRKEYVKMIFLFLHLAKHNSWHHLVIGDESWFS
jgi:hypothetical protein